MVLVQELLGNRAGSVGKLANGGSRGRDGFAVIIGEDDRGIAEAMENC